ncbi:hypothetical protein HF521_000642 [Silurus meridionalis]|uniref:Uncharacterized protein n=1 Tax=Silurus meridionalis TaxID=175797 RepID=A0A8T0BWC6_SILME|nr:hypothetical protein HF521_000642 [Silurus meridionalis]
MMSGKTTKARSTTQSQLRPGATVVASPSRDSPPCEGPIVPQAASKADIDSLKSELLSSMRPEITQAVKAQLSSDKAVNEAAVRERKGTVVKMERSLSVCTDDIAVVQRDIQRLTAEFNKLETKCEDLEARSRRDNIWIIGVPKGFQ